MTRDYKIKVEGREKFSDEAIEIMIGSELGRLRVVDGRIEKGRKDDEQQLTDTNIGEAGAIGG